MNEVTTFTFTDTSSGDEVCVVVRCSEVCVALAISLSKDGDIEVVMQKEAVGKLINALTDARSRMQGNQ